MILNFKAQKQETNASAKVVDGKLILTLPDAQTPVVWQMDLAQAKSSALEVREDKEENTHKLTLKTPKGETVEVAVFSNRKHAIEGMMSAASALENAHGNIRNTEATGNANNTKAAPAAPIVTSADKRKKWVSALLGFVVLFILFTLWGAVLPTSVSPDGQAPRTTSSADPAATGVPVSADDFLNAQ